MVTILREADKAPVAEIAKKHGIIGRRNKSSLCQTAIIKAAHRRAFPPLEVAFCALKAVWTDVLSERDHQTGDGVLLIFQHPPPRFAPIFPRRLNNLPLVLQRLDISSRAVSQKLRGVSE
ncbi:hypothetical protein [Rhodocyclus tenuis]|uniref:Uncharacterized protein n=1 Tax=Rhodocyclus tenuis TaxID=1066 RepID=A0A840GAD2_RHOTE|nr:hypothetical protein [Rhodocyclus tenuis]MBB4248806.1 hypothetical protein [Rhodocyclus tenuis]